MKRRGDWQQRLGALIDEARTARAFEWGTFDCCLFVCEAIHAVTEIDIGDRFRGKYHDEAGAQALVGDRGLAAFIDEIAEEIGAPHIMPTYARAGDVVLAFNQDNQPTIGVVDLSFRFARFASPRGLFAASMKHWRQAWRIG